MSEQLSTVAISILDKEYRVSCHPDQQRTLVDAAHHLDEKMRAIRSTGKIIGTERIAVMAAINITHDMLKAAQDNNLTNQHDEKKISDMVVKLERVLQGA